MTIFKDQLNREIKLHQPPKRIVSLVPSQTELLADLGLENEVVAITKFCVHPQRWFYEKKRIGGTKKLHIAKIRSLKPDLILANKEENDKEQLETLMEEFPVWISDIYTLEDALEMIRAVGRMTQKRDEAFQMADEIANRFKKYAQELQENAASASTSLRGKKAAYFIWRNPWMVAANHTFINEMLQHCGLRNVFANLSRYPVIAPTELTLSGVERILLSSEPFPFKKQHADDLRRYAPDAVFKMVDGEIFSWYGSRLLQAPDYFRAILTQ